MNDFTQNFGPMIPGMLRLYTISGLRAINVAQSNLDRPNPGYKTTIRQAVDTYIGYDARGAKYYSEAYVREALSAKAARKDAKHGKLIMYAEKRFGKPALRAQRELLSESMASRDTAKSYGDIHGGMSWAYSDAVERNPSLWTEEGYETQRLLELAEDVMNS